MSGTILVTGATGSLGRAVVKALAADQIALRTASRRPQKSQAEDAPESVHLSFEKPTSFDSALAGVHGVFLIAPPLDQEAPAKLNPFIDRAKALGVGHIVLNSAFGVEYNEAAPLRVVERHLMAAGVPFTILRPNFFMENFSGSMAGMIRDQNGIFLAAGDAKTSFISTKDVAAVAATSFAQAPYGKEFNLTGSEALDHAEVAAILSEATGKRIAYHALPEEAMLDGLRSLGTPEPAVQYMAMLYSAVRAGYAAAVTGDVEEVTGRKPTSFGEFAREHAAAWN